MTNKQAIEVATQLRDMQQKIDGTVKFVNDIPVVEALSHLIDLVKRYEQLQQRIATLEEDNRIIDGILQEKINELTEEFAITEKLQSRIATLESRVGVEKIEETIKKEWLPKDNGRNYYVGEDDEAECIAKAISTMVLGEKG